LLLSGATIELFLSAASIELFLLRAIVQFKGKSLLLIIFIYQCIREAEALIAAIDELLAENQPPVATAEEPEEPGQQDTAEQKGSGFGSDRPSMPAEHAVEHRREEEPSPFLQHIDEEYNSHATAQDEFILQLTVLDEDLIPT